jgi:RNA polymerase sigma factor (sigma-70 family)
MGHYTSLMPQGSGDDPGGPRGTVEADYRRLYALLRDVAERKFRVPAHDSGALVNDVFTSYLVRGDGVHDPEKWLVGAVCHASRVYWRRERRAEPLPQDLPDRVDPASLGREDRLVSRLTISIALSHLCDRCRRLLRLYYVDGYSMREIAEHLGTTPHYATQLLYECRTRLRQIYRRLGRERAR